MFAFCPVDTTASSAALGHALTWCSRASGRLAQTPVYSAQLFGLPRCGDVPKFVATAKITTTAVSLRRAKPTFASRCRIFGAKPCALKTIFRIHRAHVTYPTPRTDLWVFTDVFERRRVCGDRPDRRRTASRGSWCGGALHHRFDGRHRFPFESGPSGTRIRLRVGRRRRIRPSHHNPALTARCVWQILRMFSPAGGVRVKTPAAASRSRARFNVCVVGLSRSL